MALTYATCTKGTCVTDSSTAERYYRESHQAICDLITSDNEHLPVPACPGWTLHDLLAHVTGAMQDFVSGNTEGAPGSEWTAGHIERFRETRIEAIQSAWRASLDQAGPVFRRMGDQLLPDIVTHEFDVRGALGNTEARDAGRLAASVQVMAAWGDTYYRNASIPPIQIRINGKPIDMGEGSGQLTATMDAFEASRILTGRRSVAQIRALDWSAEPTPWLEHLSLLGSRDIDLVE